MKEKMLFEDPKLEVVRFDPKDIYTGTSDCTTQKPESEGVCPSESCDDCPDDDD